MTLQFGITAHVREIPIGHEVKKSWGQDVMGLRGHGV